MTATADAPFFTAHPKQAEFARAVFSGQYRYLLFGGGVRGGKTAGSLMILFALCRIFPGSRWAIVRRDLPTIRRTILPSFMKLKPAFVGEPNQGDWTATCTNGSQILFFAESYQEDPDLNRWKGLEVNGFLLEEANELMGGKRSWDKAIERAGSWVLPGGVPQPPPVIMATCNPSPGWLKEMFYDPYVAGELEAPYYFLPALIQDNPSNSADYVASLEFLEPDQYRRFVKGEWEGLDTALLFGYLSRDTHMTVPRPITAEYRRVVAADWGWTNPAPALWIETDAGLDGPPESRVYREWWPTQTLPQLWAEEVIRRSEGEGVEVVLIDQATEAKPQDGGPSVFEQMAPTFHRAGMRLAPVQKGPNSIKHGIQLLHTYLWAGMDRQPLLTISTECPLLWKEMTALRRGDPVLHPAHDPDLPAPHQADHGTDALRYWAMSRPQPATVTLAERRRRDTAVQGVKGSEPSQHEIFRNRAREAIRQGKAPPPKAMPPKVKQHRTPWSRL